MRKIHPGFIALAIIGGPASLILAHQKLTGVHETYRPFEPSALVEEVYSECSRTQGSSRPSQCDEYIRSFDECTAKHESCDPRLIYDALVKLNFVPSDPGRKPATKPL